MQSIDHRYPEHHLQRVPLFAGLSSSESKSLPHQTQTSFCFFPRFLPLTLQPLLLLVCRRCRVPGSISRRASTARSTRGFSLLASTSLRLEAYRSTRIGDWGHLTRFTSREWEIVGRQRPNQKRIRDAQIAFPLPLWRIKDSIAFV